MCWGKNSRLSLKSIADAHGTWCHTCTENSIPACSTLVLSRFRDAFLLPSNGRMNDGLFRITQLDTPGLAVPPIPQWDLYQQRQARDENEWEFT